MPSLHGFREIRCLIRLTQIQIVKRDLVLSERECPDLPFQTAPDSHIIRTSLDMTHSGLRFTFGSPS